MVIVNAGNIPIDGFPGIVAALAAAPAVFSFARTRSWCFASSCNRVLTTQIGFVAVAVMIPAIAAAPRCTIGLDSAGEVVERVMLLGREAARNCLDCA